MSLKVYNGVRFNDPTIEHGTVYELGHELRKRLRIITYKAAAADMVKEAARNQDVRSLLGANSETWDTSHPETSVKDAIREFQTQWCGYFCKLCLYSFHDVSIGLLLNNEPKFYDEFLSFAPVIEYNFWTSSDGRPDGVSAKQWAKRGAHWGRIIKGAVTSLEVNCIDDLPPAITALDLRLATPTLDARAKNAIIQIKLIELSGECKHPHEFARVYNTVAEWASGHGKEELAMMIEEAKAKLAPEVDFGPV